MDNVDLLILGAYVKCSSYREKIVNCLADKNVMMPTELAKSCGIRANHISKVLRELKDKGIVVCLNDDARKGRLYCLTDLGRDVKGVLDDNF